MTDSFENRSDKIFIVEKSVLNAFAGFYILLNLYSLSLEMEAAPKLNCVGCAIASYWDPFEYLWVFMDVHGIFMAWRHLQR